MSHGILWRARLHPFVVGSFAVNVLSLAACGASLPPEARIELPGSPDVPTTDVTGFVSTMPNSMVAELVARGVSASHASCRSLRAGSSGPCRLDWSITRQTFKPPHAFLVVRLVEGGRVVKTVSSHIRPPGLGPNSGFITAVTRLTHELEKTDSLTLDPAALPVAQP